MGAEVGDGDEFSGFAVLKHAPEVDVTLNGTGERWGGGIESKKIPCSSQPPAEFHHSLH